MNFSREAHVKNCLAAYLSSFDDSDKTRPFEGTIARVLFDDDA